MLFGKHNFKNLYHKNHTTKQFEAYAKKRGMTVIAAAGVCGSWVKMDVALDGMVYPLTNPKQEHSEKTQESLSLWDKIKFHSKASNHAARTCDGESVPPMFQLKPGDRITHILINAKSPNEKADLPPTGARQPRSGPASGNGG